MNRPRIAAGLTLAATAATLTITAIPAHAATGATSASASKAATPDGGSRRITTVHTAAMVAHPDHSMGGSRRIA